MLHCLRQKRFMLLHLLNAGGMTASGSEVHLPALASNAGGATLTGSAVDLSALASNAGGLTVNTALAITLPKLATNAATLTLAATTVDTPILVTSQLRPTLILVVELHSMLLV